MAKEGDVSAIYKYITDSSFNVASMSKEEDGSVIMNVVQASENLWQRNITPPIFVSGNIPGGMDRNKSLIERYMPRIKHL